MEHRRPESADPARRVRLSIRQNPRVGDLPWRAVAALIGVALGAILALVIPRISRRAGIKRAAREGALWTGLANFDAAAPGQAPTIQAAMSEVGRLYGQRLSRRPDERPVAGHLHVFADRVRWEPWFYLGRGRARAWSLPRTAISGLDIAHLPSPVLNSYEAVLHTTDGPIRFLVADPEGLRAALA